MCLFWFHFILQAKVLYEGEPVQYAAQPYVQPQPVYTVAPSYPSPKTAIVYPEPAPAPVHTPAPTPVHAPVHTPVVLTTTPQPIYEPAPAIITPVTVAQPVYSPVDYAPAPVSYPHNPVYNLVVPDAEHHKIRHLQEPKHVSPLAPPPKKEHLEHHHDPYLKTEAELKYKDFSGPFFYANTKKITNKEQKKLKTHDHNRLYY